MYIVGELSQLIVTLMRIYAPLGKPGSSSSSEPFGGVSSIWISTPGSGFSISKKAFCTCIKYDLGLLHCGQRRILMDTSSLVPFPSASNSSTEIDKNRENDSSLEYIALSCVLHHVALNVPYLGFSVPWSYRWSRAFAIKRRLLIATQWCTREITVCGYLPHINCLPRRH